MEHHAYSSGKLLWLVILLLVRMPRTAWTRLNCSDPYIPGLPEFTPYHPSCCQQQSVDPSSVRATFLVRPVGVDRWELDVNISWALPDLFNNFDAYAVHTLDYTTTPYSANSCDDEYLNIDFSFTEMQWKEFHNVLFGSTPYFIIYTANRTANLINKKPSISELEFADCYESTRSLSFCRTQDIEVAGRPISLTVESLVATEQAVALPVKATVTVSWNPPAQINGELGSFVVALFINGIERLDLRTTTEVPVSLRTYSDPLRLSFNHSIVADVDNENYFKVEVAAKVNKNGDLLLGNAAILEFNVGPDNFTVPTTAPGTEVPTLYLALGAALIGLVVVIALTVGCYVCRRIQATRRADDEPALQFKRRHAESNYVVEPDGGSRKVADCFAHVECDRNILTEISTVAEIGKGSFGVVYKAFAFGTANGITEYYPVAIKGLKEGATADMKQSFLQEIRLMIDIGRHPNILSVLGCCTIAEPYLLITEYMKYGDLLHFLWKSRESKMAEVDPVYHVTELTQLQIARQIARGMEYLSQTRYYHGDLAARNILVGGNLTVKVSDFGLSDDTYEMGYKRLDEGKKRAVKWVSLETNTTNRCSIKSDVWSFGIVLYEIYTRGDVPYQGLSNREVIEKLKQGYRMARPDDCPTYVYALMCGCWDELPSKRPSFTMLHTSLDKMLERSSDYTTFEESASSLSESKHNMINSNHDEKPAKDTQHGNSESSEFSERPDKLQLWLHLKGPIPEGARTVDFVPDTKGASMQSDTPSNGKEDNKLSFKRDRDCDVLTA